MRARKKLSRKANKRHFRRGVQQHRHNRVKRVMRGGRRF